MTDYNGPERRKDYVELDHALEKVERLHSAVTTLATAVTNTVPRQELVDIKDEIKRDFLWKVYFQLGLTVICLAFLVVFFNSQFSRVKDTSRHGHAVLACLLAQPEAMRTSTLAATTLVTCEQTVRP